MTDPNILRMIDVMRPMERAAAAERADIFKWTDADVQKALDPENAEVRRLTSPPVADPEIERLSRLYADEIAPQ